MKEALRALASAFREFVSLRWFTEWADSIDDRNRGGEFGKWPWQKDYGLWPWQRRRKDDA